MKYFLTTVTMMFIFTAAIAQKQDKEAIKARVQEVIKNETFTFRPEMVYPQGRPSRFLTEQYYLLTVNNKKVYCDLPFFGEARNASLANDGGIKFSTTNYKLEKKQVKKGWVLTIIPNDNTDVKECTLTIYDSGSANLVIVSNTRSTISYDGKIIEPVAN